MTPSDQSSSSPPVPAGDTREASQTEEFSNGPCHRCGRPDNAGIGDTCWFADNELWNEVIPGRTGMLCPACFTAACEEKGIGIGWRAGRIGVVESSLETALSRAREAEAERGVSPADVERVAKAIWEDDTTESWDGAPRGERAAYLSNARAALKALGLEVETCEAIQGGHPPGGGNRCEREAGHKGDHYAKRGQVGVAWKDPDTREQVDAKLLDYFRGRIADYHITRLRRGLSEAKDDGDWHGELRFLLDEIERTINLEVSGE